MYDIIFPVISVSQLHLLCTPLRRRVQYNITSSHLQVGLPNNFTIIFIVQGKGKLKNVFIFMKPTFSLSVYLLYSWMIHRTSSPWVKKDSPQSKMKIMDYLGCSSCHSIAVLHFCLHVEDISYNVGKQTVSGLIDLIILFCLFANKYSSEYLLLWEWHEEEYMMTELSFLRRLSAEE